MAVHVRDRSDVIYRFPEHGLHGRLKLAYDWIPADADRLLDVGCAYGYGTRYFARRAARTVGVDPNPALIELARERYPTLEFRLAGVEATGFENDAFDVIVMADVFEHVADERRTLAEIHRILKTGGTLIVTVPNRGLFSFLDLDNVVIVVKRLLPALYSLLYGAKEGERPTQRAGYESWHRHYSRRELLRRIGESAFGRTFEVECVRRWGLLVDPLLSYVVQGARLVLGARRADRLRPFLERVQGLEDAVRCGPFSYNLGLRLRKR